jgi:hypothetical protein
MGTSAYLGGEIPAWPSKRRLSAILGEAGLTVAIGRYSVRVEDCSHFIFQEYGGDLGVPVIEADADSAEELLRDAKLVSEALARAGVRHRFEIYDDRPEMAGYLHHEWPL